MKIDPYKHEERYLKWKESIKGLFPKVSKADSTIILNYLSDMERGINVSTLNVKGSRSYLRLNTLREKMKFFSLSFNKKYGLKAITDISEDQICEFFSEMKRGIIKKKNGISLFITQKIFINKVKIISLVILFNLPLIIDGTTQLFKLRTSNNFLRFVTGSLSGIGCGIGLIYLIYY